MSTYNTKNYTEQSGEVTHIGGSLVFDEGATVSGFPMDAATASKIGGVKQAANQEASSASTVAGVVADLNALIGKLKTAGIMVADATE